MIRFSDSLRRHASRLVPSLAIAAALAWTAPSAAAATGSSELSALSTLPIALSVAAPVMVLSAGAVLTVVAVDGLSDGTVWVLERASDGTRMSLKLSASAAAGASVVAGTAVTASVVGAGWVLSAAGRAIAFVPNEIGQALLYDQRVTR